MNNFVESNINLSAKQHTLQVVKYLAPQSEILAMTKAHTHGYDLVCVENALEADLLSFIYC